MEQRKEKRTWLAVALAMLVTGLGHLYLRRWGRAAGWVLLAIGASAFVPPEQAALFSQWVEATLSLQSTANLAPLDPTALLPLVAVGLLSIVDVYLVARNHNAQYRAQQAVIAAGGTVDSVVQCPACGRDVDPDLDFCHWCTTRLDRPSEEHDADD